ncbi:hypothetical protein CHUAL_012997 [Chamberlinius hualienensis]
MFAVQLVLAATFGFVVNAANISSQPWKPANSSNSLQSNPDLILSSVYWCYPNYPCFQVGGPYISAYRPTSLAPYPPEKANITFELFTRRNPKTPFILTNPNNVTRIQNSNFKNTSKTIYIIAGFLLLKPLLDHDDYNIVNVNWGNASNTSYEQAVANIRMVGAMVYRLTENINDITGTPLSDFYCVGHSLGAQACGEAGKYFNGEFGRITGLDPAGLYFEDTNPVVSLDPSDAKFVDVIHTNAGTVLLGALRSYSVACSHGRAIEYYAESIPTSHGRCRFRSFPCEDYDSFKANLCHSCGDNDSQCAEMGFSADKYAELNPIPAVDGFYLQTSSKLPYCKTHIAPTDSTLTPAYQGGWLSG